MEHRSFETWNMEVLKIVSFINVLQDLKKADEILYEAAHFFPYLYA